MSDRRAGLIPWATSVVESARRKRLQLQGVQAAIVSEGMLKLAFEVVERRRR